MFTKDEKAIESRDMHCVLQFDTNWTQNHHGHSNRCLLESERDGGSLYRHISYKGIILLTIRVNSLNSKYRV